MLFASSKLVGFICFLSCLWVQCWSGLKTGSTGTPGKIRQKLLVCPHPCPCVCAFIGWVLQKPQCVVPLAGTGCKRFCEIRTGNSSLQIPWFHQYTESSMTVSHWPTLTCFQMLKIFSHLQFPDWLRYVPTPWDALTNPQSGWAMCIPTNW